MYNLLVFGTTSMADTMAKILVLIYLCIMRNP